jgi:hypothetical protein
MELAGSLLKRFGASPKSHAINSICPLTDPKGKENPYLLLVCSNYWPPFVAQFEFSTIRYFQPFNKAGLKYP